MEFANDVKGFRFNSNGEELPLKTFNFEDVVSPPLMIKTKTVSRENTQKITNPPVSKETEDSMPATQQLSERARVHSKRTRVPGRRRMRRKKVKRSAPTYPTTVCPVTVRDVGRGPVAVQVQSLVTNIYE